MTARTAVFVLGTAGALFVLPGGASSQSGQDPYGPIISEGFRLRVEDADRQIQRQQEDEAAFTTVRAYVQMYPDAFPPGFLNGLTTSNARGILPVVEFRVREYLATEWVKTRGQW